MKHPYKFRFSAIKHRKCTICALFRFSELQKREVESILNAVGIEVEYEEILCRDQDKGLYEMGGRQGT